MEDVFLIQLAEQMHTIYSQECAALPNQANIINELHPKENDHSRILRMLLEYQKNGQYSLLHSFLERLHLSLPIVAPLFRTEYGNTYDERKDRIDLLISQKNPSGNFAIIIENKACDAIDQPKQVERYWKNMLREGFKKEEIYVIYLTRDGKHNIKDSDSLGDSEEQINLLLCNYQYDILPWLDDVINLINSTDSLFKTSVELYIDYWKLIFGQREIAQPIHHKIQELMKQQLSILTISDSTKLVERLNFLQDEAQSILLDYAKSTIDEYFYNPLEQYFKNKNIEVTIEKRSVAINSFSCLIKIESWQKCWIYITNDSKGTYYNISHQSLDNRLSDDDIKKLNEEIPGGGKPTEWFPWWQYMEKQPWGIANNAHFWDDVKERRLWQNFENWLTLVFKAVDKILL